MDIDFYNTRIRQAVSDKYVECSKRKQENEQEILKAKRKLTSYMDGEEQLTYKEYIDVRSTIDILSLENNELDIELAVWDEAREICLNIADEMCE